ncbi:formate dehydrogenase, alpha subunit [Desulfonatronospira thiodismutans ASO3-1]|uniref:Formate dehydrogenase, alpha subunit n=2 Tax=Desulfonatronospira TaxID=488937 RepID=D6SNN3_9BACT|nr:formate dehydrogenase-N subunit alpha [Desulfonatronospira thiodismutans]EFI34359.1 formate dehydrogenase, alpha subunit [Desulfonatronospira thiodismutans ASO3-1]
MILNRRGFIKLSVAAGSFLAFAGLGFNMKPTTAKAQLLRINWGRETTSICCYCSVGCGLLVHTSKEGQGRTINVEGDPDHPISEGSLCAKGASVYQLAENENRLTKVLYRAPYTDKWVEAPWDWAITRIARKVKEARDETFVKTNDQGQVVNRTDGIAHVGSAALDNEECWYLQALMRSLGLVYIEHQARLCHSSSVPSLAESYGRGAMTNHYTDLMNSDCILMMGGNPAECHPVTFKWIMKAKENGATLISVDPRYNRSSSKADIFAPMRSGTDTPFLLGMVKYILDNDLYFKDYVVNYTNAAFLVNPDFYFDPEEGLFSGFQKKSETNFAVFGSYDRDSWSFQKDNDGIPKRDTSLQDPNCVFQLLKKHVERYTLDRVSETTGTPRDKLEEVYKAFAATGAPDKSGTNTYAMGWTQHTIAVQLIRSMAMIQLLLGNVGNAGGGVNALRGESNVQGSTDSALLYHIIPAYNPTPRASWPTLEDYNKANTPVSHDPKSANWWQNRPKYIASLLKAMYPDKEPSESYNYMPRLDAGQDCSWLVMFDHMHQGKFKGLFAWGMNPAVSGADTNKTREALSKLDWLVNVNIFHNETGSFWHGPGMDPGRIKTEVFMLPAAVFYEKEGSITNSGRWAQWRYEGPKPLGGSKRDGDMMVMLARRLKALYQEEGGEFPEPIANFNLDNIVTDGKFDVEKMARLHNGYFLRDKTIDGTTYKAGTQVPSFALLQDDGSTACGNWLYCGSFTEDGNLMARRDKTQTDMQANIALFPNWSWAWPVNRRVLYNRASVDKNGRPYAPDKAVIKWQDNQWVGDVPDGGWGPSEKHPFIMTTEGYGRLFGPGLVDGPFPEHYEPLECPFEEQPFSKQLHNPVALHFEGEKRAVCDPRYPFVGTTYRVTEHWQSGVMTRWTPWLLECMPELFAEIDPELAKLREINNGDKVIVENPRGRVKAVAIVSHRLAPYKVMGQNLHMVGLPWHYGWLQPKDSGDAANLLTPAVGDANTGIPETKAFMVNIRKA